MPIAAVISQKGGPGKSTVSMNLAVAAHLAGKSVAVLDTDPQCSISQWGDIREAEGILEPVVVAIPPSRLEPSDRDHARGQHRPGRDRYGPL